MTLDLEACQQQLQSKYGAVKLIQRLSRLEEARQNHCSRKALEASKKLEQVSLQEVIKGDSDSVIHIIQSILPIKTDTSLRHGQSGPVPKVSILGLFPFVRTGWPDHCSTSQF